MSWQSVGGGPGSGLVADPDGGIWTGLLNGGIAHFRGGQIQKLPLSNRAPRASARVRNLSRDRDGAIWAATDDGLSRITNGRVTTLTTANGLPCDGVHWIIEDDLSFYWLYTQCGLVRIPRTELEAWTADPQRMIQPTTFDGADGIRFPHLMRSRAFRPQVTKSSDGKIWFLNGDTASFIDPSQIGMNELPPPVHIEQITANAKTYDATRGLRLPPRVHDLTINYTALSLAAPEKVRFRFRLEGQDRDWREVVNRRDVQYSNLAPGNYVFRVTASNNSGVWNEQGDALDFSIAPAYYQTTWFLAFCLIGLAAILCGLHRLRLYHIARKYNSGLEARVNERMRIARDLHDTLLQSFNGLLLRFQTAYDVLPPNANEAREHLERAIDQSARAITEGREAVQALRTSTLESNDLAVDIMTIGKELEAGTNNGNTSSYQVAVKGKPRNLHPILRDEIYKIAVEALRNAFQHAEARKIEVEVRYEEKRFSIHIRDDGKGIDPQVLNEGRREGHFGLHGMHERAAIVGGKLAIWSGPGGGTEIELTIPASRAYLKSRQKFPGRAKFYNPRGS
jgi:signal transduction histidine kinase